MVNNQAPTTQTIDQPPTQPLESVEGLYQTIPLQEQ